MDPLSKRFLSLYRQIMKTHNKILPFNFRVVGNLYVREEFKKHSKAEPKYKVTFLNEWDKYLTEIKNSDGNFGREMTNDEKEKLNDLQKQQLAKLKEETYSAFAPKEEI